MTQPSHTPATGTEGERYVQQVMGTSDRAARFYRDQMLDHLNPEMRAFIARQEMLFIATADDRGECDSSFRAGPPGFVHVIDERGVSDRHQQCAIFPNSLISRIQPQTFQLGGFDLTYDCASDVELMMRFMEVGGARSRYLPETIVRMRMGGQSTSGLRRLWRQNREDWRAIREHRLDPNIFVFIWGKLMHRGKQLMARPE
jgi:hypothetical protein